MKRCLAIVGMRAVGKSTVGLLLAPSLGLELWDSDDIVQTRMGATISEVFASGNQADFRRLEGEVCRECLEEDGRLLVTGGGVVEDVNTRDALRQAFTVWLDASVGTLKRRMQGSSRPALLGDDPMAELAELERRRRPLYAEVARESYLVDELELKAVCDAIEQSWKGLSVDDFR